MKYKKSYGHIRERINPHEIIEVIDE